MDYREKLNIGFSDKQRLKYFITKVFNYIYNCLDYDSDESMRQISVEEYYKFCDMTGTEFDPDSSEEFYYEIISEIHSHQGSLEDFLSFYIAFLNCQNDKNNKPITKLRYKEVLLKMMDESHFLYDVYEDEDGCFVFPKGAKELDDALVSDVLLWLASYPGAHKTYVTALKQYSEGIYIRDVADNLRKALETFLQEFLNNTKNLENNKEEICKYLGQKRVDSGIIGLFQPIISAYKNINDRTAKHNDKVDEKLLEFLLYQTGVMIRMVLVVDKG